MDMDSAVTLYAKLKNLYLAMDISKIKKLFFTVHQVTRIWKLVKYIQVFEWHVLHASDKDILFW